jgi:hypothetical protein
MSYKITMSVIDTLTVCNAMNTLVDHIRLTLEGDTSIENLLLALKKDYGIIVNIPVGHAFIGPYNVEFPSEKDYLMFLLRWS